MAFCPKCSGAMNATDAVCPHCGYDFPPPPPEKGIEDSRFADIVLIFGAFAAGLLSLIAFGQLAIAVLHLFVEFYERGIGDAFGVLSDFGVSAGLALLQALLYFAVMVVFSRVRKIKD